MHTAAAVLARPGSPLPHQHREHHGRWHRRGIARRAFRGATPLNSGSRLAATGGTWLEEGSDFLSDQQCWYECAAAWHIPGRDPAQQPGAPAQHSSSATGRLAAVIRASPAAADEGYTDMEGLSDQEEWVFGSCCEAAACWCSELDAWSCQEPAAAPAAPAGPAAHATDGPATSDEGGPLEPVEWGLFDSGSCPASAALTQDYSQGDWMAGVPEEEQLRSRGSVLASVDGMVGNWEVWSTGSSSSGSTVLTGSTNYDEVLSQLSQLEARVRRGGLQPSPLQRPAAEAGNSGGDVGKFVGTTDVQ